MSAEEDIEEVRSAPQLILVDKCPECNSTDLILSLIHI